MQMRLKHWFIFVAAISLTLALAEPLRVPMQYAALALPGAVIALRLQQHFRTSVWWAALSLSVGVATLLLTAPFASGGWSPGNSWSGMFDGNALVATLVVLGVSVACLLSLVVVRSLITGMREFNAARRKLKDCDADTDIDK